MHEISCVIIMAVLTLTEKPSNASTSVIVALYNRSLPFRMKRLSGRVRTTNCKQNMTLASANAPSEFWQVMSFAIETVLLCHCNADCVKLNPGQKRCQAVAHKRRVEAKEHCSTTQHKSVCPPWDLLAHHLSLVRLPQRMQSPASYQVVYSWTQWLNSKATNKVSSSCVMQHDNCR